MYHFHACQPEFLPCSCFAKHHDDAIDSGRHAILPSNSLTISCHITPFKYMLQHLPSSANGLPKHANPILCSGSVFVNDKNEIFTTGFGSKGGKGTGGILSLSEDSQKLHDWLPPYVQEQEVVILAGGVDHSVLVLSNGQVFGWGNGRKGQLGHPAEIVRSPRQFQKLKFPVTRAVCGREFTYLVGSDGRHTILGSNKHGIQSPDFTKTLTIPKTIAASWGSLFVLDSSGQIKSWGRNDHGQLAPPNLPPIAQIAAGSEHVVALTEGSLMQSGKVISWGWGEHGNCGAEIDENGDIKKGTWNEIHTHHSVLGVGAGCATSFFWTDG